MKSNAGTRHRADAGRDTATGGLRPRLLHALLIAGLTILAGCQNTPPRSGSLEHMKGELAKGVADAEAQPAVPAEVAKGLVPALRLDTRELPKMQDEQRFDISVNDVPADQFFMSLVDGTKYNMVVHPEVKGTISLNLKNVTVPDVIAAARDVYGYEFERTSYGFQVLPSRLESRVYQINYLNVNRSGTSSTFVSAGTLQEGPNAPRVRSADSGGAESSGGGDQGGHRGRGQRTTVGTQVNTVFPETTFWKELATSLEAIVGGAEGRSVVVNPQSGVVVVRAIPTELREVEAYLQAAQLIAQRQVILEAKILEVELSDGFQSGINWSTLAGDFEIGQTGGGQSLTPTNKSGYSELQGTKFDLFPGVGAISTLPASAFGGVFSAAVNGKDFKAFLELLQTQGNVQVLSSPRISTMNNQKAIIKVGTDEFFVTDVSTTTITGTSTTSTPNIELTPFFSGIALDVTPQISNTGDVMLHIHPSVSDVTDQQKNITIAGVAQTLPLARSTVRESDSVVQAKNGQLVVIGGLMQNQESDVDAKTPALGDLPLVGALFRHKRVSGKKSELVILLRPQVVETQRQWSEAFKDTSQQVETLQNQLQQWNVQRGPKVGLRQPPP